MPEAASMQIVFLNSINAISADEWQATINTDSPFLRHAFLAALENSNSVSPQKGWQAHHLTVRDSNSSRLLAVMPLYIKQHSYGEYVFDWSWADAYQRCGKSYYPKLLSAIPFTPATGNRLCVTPGQAPEPVQTACWHALLERLERIGGSSLHILFPSQHEMTAWQQQGALNRSGVQYHWLNKGYSNFDDFLQSFNSRKRKNVKKERKRVYEQGITLDVLEGADIGPSHWQAFYHCYQLTYAKRSGHGGYLNREFFDLIAQSMPEQIVMIVAKSNDTIIAAALCFRSSDTLYGRYWGCLQEVDNLHFETCYYQGIEYCIQRGLRKFDPGAQGEHKIQRGFVPTETFSSHWLADPQLARAIEDFLTREKQHITQYLAEARSYLPFK
jgi:hypothetical protein